MELNRSLCWIRRDLRLSDHRALFEACSRSREVVVVFVFDTTILDQLPDKNDSRVTFIAKSLEEVAEGLRKHGSELACLHGDPIDLIPQFAKEIGAEAVFASHDHDPYAIQRDAEVKKKLGEIVFHTFKDCVVFEDREVLSQAGEPLKVYTPYMKAWRAKLTQADVEAFEPDFSKLAPAARVPGKARGCRTLEEIGFEEGPLWLAPGERGAHERLAWFLEFIEDYGETRDFPGVEGTSGLSVHLRHGTISIREALRASLGRQSAGSVKWTNELIWREFYHMILACFPWVVEEPFQRHLGAIRWPGNPEHLDVWKEGRTGYPIVDAAMRCLKETGWMHNRLRMIVASFLTKDLLLDWRLGEEWFEQKLLDFELASNSGGWQWSASVGVDAQPYFRVFNPVLQSRKFDPDGRFIREWVPELSGWDDKLIHWPHDASLMEQLSVGCELGKDYPHPIVDHHVQKDLAIGLFRQASG